MNEFNRQNRQDSQDNGRVESSVELSELQGMMKERLFSIRGVYAYFDEGGETVELVKGSRLFCISKNPLCDVEGIPAVWVQDATVTKIDRKNEYIECEIIGDIPRKFTFEIRTGLTVSGLRKEWLSLKDPLKCGMTERDMRLLMQS